MRDRVSPGDRERLIVQTDRPIPEHLMPGPRLRGDQVPRRVRHRKRERFVRNVVVSPRQGCSGRTRPAGIGRHTGRGEEHPGEDDAEEGAEQDAAFHGVGLSGVEDDGGQYDEGGGDREREPAGRFDVVFVAFGPRQHQEAAFRRAWSATFLARHASAHGTHIGSFAR